MEDSHRSKQFLNTLLKLEEEEARERERVKREKNQGSVVHAKATRACSRTETSYQHASVSMTYTNGKVELHAHSFTCQTRGAHCAHAHEAGVLNARTRSVSLVQRR